ncbi:MAG: sulfite exporter TauE/SafE family protein [Fimbriimonadales bacterium]|nr:sulfite exporter TauE/SafE family protein [Fimbriimonadales bacterium]
MSTLWIFPIAIGAGAFGVMLGLGGGIILVPALTLLMGVPIKQAVAASLVAVAATSCAGVPAYLQAGLVDWRLCVRLLIPTLLGAIAGGLLIGYIPEAAVRWLFIGLVLYVMAQMLWSMRHPAPPQEARPDCRTAWSARERGIAIGLSGLAGAISALLGVGGGLIQVPLIHTILKAPLRCAIGSSTFLIGATASASALLYLVQGKLQPDIVVPATLGILIGARAGVKLAQRVPTLTLRLIFVGVMLYTVIRFALK